MYLLLELAHTIVVVVVVLIELHERMCFRSHVSGEVLSSSS